MIECRCANGHAFAMPAGAVPTTCPVCPGGKRCEATTFETGHYTERTGRWSPDGPAQAFKATAGRR